MNIQKTDLLLLNKIRFAGRNEEPQVPAQQTEKSAEAGMKALSFEGMKNVMSNPSLAQRIAADGGEETKANTPTFKGGMKNKLATAAVVLASLAAASSVTSCKPEGDEYTQIAEQNVKVEQSAEMMAFFQAILEELKGMRQDMKDRDATYQKNFSQVINMVLDVYNLLQQGLLDAKSFMEKVLENQSAITYLMEQQGIKSDKANQLLQNILNSNMSIDEKVAAIKALVTDIRDMFAKALEYAEKAQQDRAELKDYAKGTFVNSSKLVQMGEQVLVSDSIKIANQEQIIAKLDLIDADMNTNAEGLSEQLNIEHKELVNVLIAMGYTQAQIEKMTTKEIVAAINNNTNVTKAEDKKIRDAIGKVGTDLNAAKTEILEALEKIDGHILDLTGEFKKYAKSQQKYNFLSLVYAKQTADNTAKTAKNTKYTNVLVENLYNSIDSLSFFDNGLGAKMDSLITVVKEADASNQAGQTEIVNAIKDAKAVLVSLGVKIDGLSDEEILAELKKQTALLNDQKAELVAIRKDLAALKQQHAAGLIKDEEYSKKASEYSERIIELLKNTKLDTASILIAIGDLNENVEIAGKNYEDALKNIQNNTYYSSYYTQKLFEAYEADAPQREAMKIALEKLIPYLKSIDGTTTNIYEFLKNQGVDKSDIDRVIKAIQKAAGDQIDVANANTATVVANLETVIANQEIQIGIERDILDKIKEISNKIGSLSPVDPERVDLTKIEKSLADILAAIKDINIPDNTALITEIRDAVVKLKNCECNCGELKVVVERIEKLIIENQNKDEGIRDNDNGLTF